MPTVMIVDDDKTTVMLLTTFLELEDFKVVNSPRGSLVMDKARQEKPDLFMIDYRLSDIDGLQVIRQLRASQEFGKTPIVMSSGMNVEDEALKAGANVFLTKPLEPSQLPVIFNSLLRKS